MARKRRPKSGELRREELMRRKFFDLALGAMLLAVCFPAQAQQPTRIPHIGILTTFSPSVVSARIEGFRQGLRELGYVEGKNIVIEWRSAGGNNDRLPVLAAELVGLKVDVIVSPGPTATRAFKEATSTIPVVMAQDTDPVGSGSSPAWRGPVGTSLGWQLLLPRWAANNWIF